MHFGVRMRAESTISAAAKTKSPAAALSAEAGVDREKLMSGRARGEIFVGASVLQKTLVVNRRALLHCFDQIRVGACASCLEHKIE